MSTAYVSTHSASVKGGALDSQKQKGGGGRPTRNLKLRSLIGTSIAMILSPCDKGASSESTWPSEKSRRFTRLCHAPHAPHRTIQALCERHLSFPPFGSRHRLAARSPAQCKSGNASRMPTSDTSSNRIPCPSPYRRHGHPNVLGKATS